MCVGGPYCAVSHGQLIRVVQSSAQTELAPALLDKLSQQVAGARDRMGTNISGSRLGEGDDESFTGYRWLAEFARSRGDPREAAPPREAAVDHRDCGCPASGGIFFAHQAIHGTTRARTIESTQKTNQLKTKEIFTGANASVETVVLEGIPQEGDRRLCAGS